MTLVPEPAPDAPGVFISYSRRDCLALADELKAGLELAGFRPMLDRHDISAAEEWEARLGALIREADIVLFIISPASLESRYCKWEVNLTLDEHKRLVPILGAEIKDEDVPARLAAFNRIDFQPGRGFAQPLRELVATLRQNIGWIREHTRLTLEAQRWKARGEPIDLLLRGETLREALDWAAQRADDAPEISTLLRQLLDASASHAQTEAEAVRAQQAEHERMLREREAAVAKLSRVQRHWAIVLCASAIIVVGVAAFAWSRVAERRQQLETERAAFLVELAQREVAENRPVNAMLLALEAIADDIDVPRTSPLDAAQAALLAAELRWRDGWGERRVFAGNTGIISSAAISPDGSRALTGTKDGWVLLWDTATGRVVRPSGPNAGQTFLQRGAAVGSVAFSPDGKHVLTGAADGIARLIDPISATVEATFTPDDPHPPPILAVAFSADGSTVLTGSSDRTAKLWNIATRHMVQTFTGHEDAIRAVAISRDGRYVATGSADGTARVWDARSGNLLAKSARYSRDVMSVAISPDSKFVLIGISDGTARLLNAETGEEVHSLDKLTGPVLSVAFSPDGRFLLTGSADRTARLWDATSYQERRVLKGHTGPVASVAFSLDGTRILTGSRDGRAVLWDTSSDDIVASVVWSAPDKVAVSLSRQGKRAITRTAEGLTRLWDIENGREIAHLGDNVVSYAFAPDGAFLVTGSSDGSIRLWDATTGVLRASLASHDGSVTSIAVTRSGTGILTGSADKTARLWDTGTRQMIRAFKGHEAPITSVAFSFDERFVVTGSEDDTARLWDPATNGSAIAIFPKPSTAALHGHPDESGVEPADTGNIEVPVQMTTAVTAVAMSPNGRFLLTGSADGSVGLWNIESGEEVRSFVGHTGSVTSVAFSGDGGLILTSSSDMTARLWDAQTTHEILAFTMHQASISAARFSDDGKRVLTEAADGTVRSWAIAAPTSDFLEHIRSQMPRCLTYEQWRAFHLMEDPPRWCHDRNIWPYRIEDRSPD